MEEKSDDILPPPSKPIVGIIFNCKRHTGEESPDAEAEYDNLDTVYAIRDALASAQLQVVLMEFDQALPKKLLETHIDFAFNIAEGRSGRGREAEAPALLNLMGIPFTGSDETALCIALDKALCKRLLSTYRIRTPRYRVISKDRDIRQGKLKFPVIVKPNSEGSSKGISDACIVSNVEELHTLAVREIKLYGGTVLAEEYIAGREFTVGLLGNGENLHVFPPMEIVFKKSTDKNYRIYSFGVKQNYKEFVDYQCPAKLDPALEHEMMQAACRVFKVLGCHDFARVDFRLTEDGTLYFIEINPLPGLEPGYSDYPMLAEFSGVSYRELVLSVLNAGLSRCGWEMAK